MQPVIQVILRQQRDKNNNKVVQLHKPR